MAKLTERQRQLYEGEKNEESGTFSRAFIDPYFGDAGGPVWGSGGA